MAGSVRQGLREPPEGCEILHSRDNELLIDIDNVESWQQFLDMLPHVDEEFKVTRVEVWPSRSKGAHARVTLQFNLYDADKYLVQAVLGSDPLRELLNLYDLRRFYLASCHVNILFKPERRRDGAE